LQVGHSITHPVEHTLKAPPRASTPLSLFSVFGGNPDAIGCVKMGQVRSGFPRPQHAFANAVRLVESTFALASMP
jgi:hypothetical protein